MEGGTNDTTTTESALTGGDDGRGAASEEKPVNRVEAYFLCTIPRRLTEEMTAAARLDEVIVPVKFRMV